jgi:SAM-dependent methyltransferase
MTTRAQEVPYPPIELASRVGSLAEHEDPFGSYDLVGRETRDALVSLLPPDWSWEGARVLDFGSGAGRTLRHFLDEARLGTFWACDIDRDSIDWVDGNLSPPFRVFVSGETPPLPFEPSSLDLIYAVSVFTHLAETWSEWLLELHRILAADGYLVVTFIGPGAAPYVTDEPWDQSRIGMNVLKPGQSWDLGGPMVVHSPWWLTARWGRAFDILKLRLDGFGLPSPEGQGAVLMRKRAIELEPGDLEEPEPGEPREAVAALNNVRQLIREATELRSEIDRARNERAALAEQVARMRHSRSWRLTAPLRRIGRSLRRRR